MKCKHSGIVGLLTAILVVGLTSPLLSQQAPRRYALVVGVREYPVSDQLPDLAFTEPDAVQLAATLTRGGFEVTLMTKTAAEGPGNGRFQPGARLIRNEFDKMVKTPFLSEQDCLVVILNGHGIQLASKDDAEKKTYYFCPSDADITDLKFAEDVRPQHNLIPVQELYDTLNHQDCTAGVKLLVVDACRNDPTQPQLFRAASSATRPPLPVPPGGIAAFFSCSAGQQAMEDPDLKHGVFTHYLNEGLNGSADTDQDGQITIPELNQYVGRKVYDFVNKKYGRRQLPELSSKIQGFAPLLAVPSTPAESSPKTVMTPRPGTTPGVVTPTPLPEFQGDLIGTKAGDLWEKNTLTMKFRWCPPGTFTMGSPENEPYHGMSENQVEVTLSQGFWLGQHEVTQAEWKKIMGTTPWQGQREVKEGDSYPATYVSWNDASAFCSKLTAQERAANRLPAGWEYTLPTEAQWEYACRAGTVSRYSFGEDESKLGEYAWFYGNAINSNERYAHEVGKKQPNAWGLHDMHGNVWEWCRDWYQLRLPGGTDPDVQEQAAFRVLRGGCWYYKVGDCRCANRSHTLPDNRVSGEGFRVALALVR